MGMKVHVGTCERVRARERGEWMDGRKRPDTKASRVQTVKRGSCSQTEELEYEPRFPIQGSFHHPRWGGSVTMSNQFRPEGICIALS